MASTFPAYNTCSHCLLSPFCDVSASALHFGELLYKYRKENVERVLDADAKHGARVSNWSDACYVAQAMATIGL
jgi:hypothetical protein